MGNQLPAVIRVSDHPSLRAWLKTGTVMGMFEPGQGVVHVGVVLGVEPVVVGLVTDAVLAPLEETEDAVSAELVALHGKVPVEAILEDKLRPYSRGGLLEVRHRFGVPRLVNVTCTARFDNVSTARQCTARQCKQHTTQRMHSAARCGQQTPNLLQDMLVFGGISPSC